MSDSTLDEILPPDFLALLRCPDDGSRLGYAPADLVERLNAAIAAGELQTIGGASLSGALIGGLIRADGARLYPVVDGITVLLADEAIALDPPHEPTDLPAEPGTEHAA